MSANAVVPLLSPLGAEQIPFLSLPVLVHEHIVSFVGGGGEDFPETYVAILIVLADVMPFFEEMVHRWFSSRFVTMLTVPGLRLEPLDRTGYCSFPNPMGTEEEKRG